MRLKHEPECEFWVCWRCWLALATAIATLPRGEVFKSCEAAPGGLLAAGNLLIEPTSNEPVRRSVAVSTSTLSSARGLRPPLAQIVQQDEAPGDDATARRADQAHQSAPGKIRALVGEQEPADISQLRRQRKLQNATNGDGAAEARRWQWLRPRRAGEPAVSAAVGARQPDGAPLQARSSASGDAAGPGAILRGAKRLLSGGLASVEQRAGGFLWLGSNALAALIPVVSLLSSLAPSSSPGESPVAAPPAPSSNQTRRNSLAGRVAGSLAQLANGQQLAAALAAASNGAGLSGRVDYVMGWLERSVEHLPSFPRLHPQECVKRSICEAHHEPHKYGAVGLTLRLLFPASPANGSELEMDRMEYKVINKYRHAAGYGLSRRLDVQGSNNSSFAPTSSAVCKEKYDDCLVSLLEVGQKLLDFFLR